MPRRVVALAREHWGIAAVLALGLALRVCAWIAYWPGLMYSDSWSYVDLAYHGTPVGISPTRPIGYPLILRVLSLPGKSIAAITGAQHLAGLLIALLVYAILVRLGTRRWLAVA